MSRPGFQKWVRIIREIGKLISELETLSVKLEGLLFKLGIIALLIIEIATIIHQKRLT
jgi:hypothetical protein